MSSIVDFRDLRVWNDARTLAKSAYDLTRRLPPEERFALSVQIRKCAISIPGNIAEGNGRFYRAEYRRAVSTARGESSELMSHLILATDVGYFREAEIRPTLSLCSGINRGLWVLHASLDGD